MSDKDIHTLVPVKKTDSKDEGKAGAGKEAAAASGESGGAAPAAAAAGDTEAPSGGGGDQESGGGGGDGGEEGKRIIEFGKESDAHLTSDSAPASEDAPGEEGEVKARPVSVANTTQCCGGLKSGVCTLL